MAFGFIKAIGRGFRFVFRAFGGVFKSEMAKFVARYETIFAQVIISIAEGQLEGDSSKRDEAFARLKRDLAGVPGGFRDHWVNWGLETVLAKLKAQGKL